MGRKPERGIYVVVHERTGKVEYVGKSAVSITNRIERDHKPNGRVYPGIETVKRVAIRDAERRSNVEARLIRTLDPPRNKRYEPVKGGVGERIGSWFDTRRIVKGLRR